MTDEEKLKEINKYRSDVIEDAIQLLNASYCGNNFVDHDNLAQYADEILDIIKSLKPSDRSHYK